MLVTESATKITSVPDDLITGNLTCLSESLLAFLKTIFTSLLAVTRQSGSDRHDERMMMITPTTKKRTKRNLFSNIEVHRPNHLILHPQISYRALKGQ